MTKHPMADLHVRIPASTKALADAMAAEDAAPHKPNLSRWLADLVEAEHASRAAFAAGTTEAERAAKKHKAKSEAKCSACNGAGYVDGATCRSCGLSFELCGACDGNGTNRAEGKGKR